MAGCTSRTSRLTTTMADEFDWQTETLLRGTVSRVQQWVRGDCPQCGAVDELVYDTYEDETLLCASCSRARSLANPRKETCDDCGAEGAWRDPISKSNSFYCAQHHAARGHVFQNRWADAARVGRRLGIREKPKCSLADYGTECKGEVKWRSNLKASACNKHAGKTSSGPEWHQ